MVQLPVLVRVTVAKEMPVVGLIDSLPIEQLPEALKLTCNIFAMLLDWAVA